MCKNTSIKSEPVKRTTVVNLRGGDYDVYIGRPGRGQDGYFGNPHPIGYCRICKCSHDRTESIAAFEKDFRDRLNRDPEFKNRVLDLRGKKLGCFCKPEACHGDIIANYVDAKVCSNCDQPIAEPTSENIRYHLCDTCINCSIIGYDAPEGSA